MTKRTILLASILVSACSRSGSDGAGRHEPEAARQGGTAAAPARIAYGYAYGFAVPAAAIGAAQDRHVALCERLGPARCRVLETHRSTGEYGGGSAKLAVASAIARRFGAGLVAPVEALGGELVSSDVEAEDIGRQIVDVDARMRAKQALVVRLEQLLRTRNGPVADLVAAEKAVADAQGELEAVRAELKQAQGRIVTSPIDIAYARRTSFASDVADAFGAVGATLTASVVALIYFLAAAIPWLGVGALAFVGIRRVRHRRKARPAHPE